MTAPKKKTVRTRRGVEPTGRPARREVERGRRARTNSSRTFAQRVDDVNPVVFGVARERLRGGREAAAAYDVVARREALPVNTPT